MSAAQPVLETRPETKESEAHPRTRPRVVVVGGGFGGAYCARSLIPRANRLGADVLLIDRNNYFIFYPLLIEAGTGSLEPRHAVIALRAFVGAKHFRMGAVQAVDTSLRRVSYEVEPGLSYEVGYDHLVLAVGSITRLPAVPGLHEYGYEMKSMIDAVGLRDRAIRLLEIADATPDRRRRRALLHFVVVGANFTGTEVAGEFNEFLRDAAKLYRNVGWNDCRITLVERGSRILEALDPELSAYATRNLSTRDVRILLNTTAVRITAEHAELSTGERLDTHTVVWCAGVAPNPLIRELPLPTDQRGYILCERDLRVKGFDDVWAIGDCAVNVDARGRSYPATAQHAVQQAYCLADNLIRVLSGHTAGTCDITTRGSLAALGCRTGVARVYRFKFSGFFAWWLYRTYYLLRMPGLRRKLRVAIDWTLELLFPRDFVQLGVHDRRRGD